MTERLKNVGLAPDVHRELKLLCAETGYTMTEAVRYLMDRIKDDERKRAASNSRANRGGKSAVNKPQ